MSFTNHLATGFWLTVLLLASVAEPSVAQTTFATANEYYEDARTRSSDGDYSSAIVQLKNALQISPDHLPSMILLGEIYLDQGNPNDAVNTLNDALLQGGSPATIIPKLLDAYLSMGANSQLISLIKPEGQPIELRRQIFAAHAEALLGLGRVNEASARVKQALELGASERAKKVEVLIMLRRGQIAEALAVSEQLIREYPDSASSWASRGAALQFIGRIDQSIDAYQNALRIDDSDLDAVVALINLLVGRNRWQEAGALVADLREYRPLDARGAYFEALIAAEDGDRDAERSALLEAAGIIDALTPEARSARGQLLIIGALSHFSLGAFGQAKEYAEQYLASNPRDMGVEKLLIVAQLELGEQKQAIQKLLTINRAKPDDAEIIRLLASAYSQSGDFAKAAELLTRLGGSDSETVIQRQQRGLTLLNAGRSELGLDLLISAADSEGAPASLTLPLATALLAEGLAEEALLRLESAATREPENLLVQNLIPVALTMLGRLQEAEQAWRKITIDSPDFYPPYVNLAKLKREQDDLAEARLWLERVPSEFAETAGALYERAKLEQAEGTPEKALRTAERLVQVSNFDLEGATLLVELFARQGKLAEAEDTARKAVSANDGSMASNALLGQTLALTGQPNQAALVYTQMSRRADFDPVALNRIAILQAELGVLDSALSSVNNAVQSDPAYRPARYLQLDLLLALALGEQLGEASARFVIDFPNDARGYQYLGESALLKGEFAASEEHFLAAAARGAGPSAAIGRYRVMKAQKRYDEAQIVLETSLAEFPNEVGVMAALSDLNIARNDWESAVKYLDLVLKARPNSYAHLHNRALARHALGLPGAVDDARAALRIAPQSPALNDTLGWLLTGNGQAQDGLQYLREATARNGENPQFAYHLAVALAELGRTREALAELYRITESGREFDELADALALQKELFDD